MTLIEIKNEMYDDLVKYINETDITNSKALYHIALFGSHSFNIDFYTPSQTAELKKLAFNKILSTEGI